MDHPVITQKYLFEVVSDDRQLITIMAIMLLAVRKLSSLFAELPNKDRLVIHLHL